MALDKRVSIDITSATIFRVILITLGFWLVYQVLDVVLMIFGAFIVASAIEPLARSLSQYRIPRAASVAIVYVLALMFVLGVFGLMLEPITRQATSLIATLPQAVERASELTPIVPTVDRETIEGHIRTTFVNYSGNIATAGANIFAGTRTFFSGFVTLVFVFVIALYLVIDDQAVKRFARLFTPSKDWAYVDSVIERAQRGVGRWVLGQLVLGTVVGVLIGTGLWILGVPFALLLGILAGIMEIIPVIGPAIAAVPGIIIAATQGWLIGLIALAYYVIVGQIESHVLIPNIMKRAVGLRPLVTILAVLIGARLGGTVGIILAVPVAAILSLIVSDVSGRPKKKAATPQTSRT